MRLKLREPGGGAQLPQLLVTKNFMPRKAAQPSLADQQAAPGGAAAVDRALSLLGAFRSDEGPLSLAELSARTQLYKSTALRLLASLEHFYLIKKLADGNYTLGPEIVRLHSIYAASFSLQEVVMPVLRRLTAETKESASFHVRQGDDRLCLHRVDSPHLVRDHTKAGDLLPLGKGAGGRVLVAYSGGKGAVYAKIRREQIAVVSGDRVPELAGISAPAFGPDGGLVGAVTLSIPVNRLDMKLTANVHNAAVELTRALGGNYPDPE
jgi:DNA-binding IclR family transcriptional regulator